MPQDWFAQNAPQQPQQQPAAGEDWFAQNAPSVSDTAKQHLAGDMGLSQIPSSPTNSLSERIGSVAQGAKKAITGSYLLDPNAHNPYSSPEAFQQGLNRGTSAAGAIGRTISAPVGIPAGYLAGKGAEALGASPETAQAVGDVGEQVGSMAAGEAVNKGLDATGRKLYKSGMKLDQIADTPEEANALSDFGRQEKIGPSVAGKRKVQGIIDTEEANQQAIVGQNPNAPISKSPAIQNLANKRQKFQEGRLDEAAATAPFDEAEQNLIAKGGGGSDLTAIEAQKLKKGMSSEIGDANFGEQRTPKIEALKAVRAGVKDELYKAFPDLGESNAREGMAIKLKPAVENVINSHQAILAPEGLPLGAAVGVVSHSPGVGAAAYGATVLRRALANNKFKARLAMAMSDGSVQSVASNMARLGAYRASPDSEAKPKYQKTGIFQGRRVGMKADGSIEAIDDTQDSSQAQ